MQTHLRLEKKLPHSYKSGMLCVLGKQTTFGIDLKLRTKINLQRNNVKYSLNPTQGETVTPFMIQTWQRKVTMWPSHLSDVEE